MGLQPTQGHETFGPHRFVISTEAQRSGEICGFAFAPMFFDKVRRRGDTCTAVTVN
jgi:hypothetical protein